MNPCLNLAKEFMDSKRDKWGFSSKPTFYQSQPVTLNHIEKLYNDLLNMQIYWNNKDLLGDITLISSFCFELIAKSNRISELFHFQKIRPNDLIVGALLDDNGNHIFTYKITKEQLDTSIKLLFEVITRFKEVFGHQVSPIESTEELSKTRFIEIIRELSYVKSFDVYLTNRETIDETEIVSLFDLDNNSSEVLKKLEVNLSQDSVMDGSQLLLTPKEYKKIYDKAPYLIAMSVSDFTQIPPITKPKKLDYISPVDFPKPGNEPIIGVIDTLFDDKVYFSNWVESHVLIEGEKKEEDFIHGTAVTSLIVDLPNLMPNLDDHCGRFRVRHFGVSRSNRTSSFFIMKKIKEIVNENSDIHVWNLSLGSTREINPNCISPEAALLDDLQRENPNIIFVVSGTNLNNQEGEKYIGAPADSINSLVVNSSKNDGNPASYTRHGPALGFFVKPDISYYGGDIGQELYAFFPGGVHSVCGTSYAAPLVARKLAYLIDIMKIPRNCAKAMIIDSAIGWEKKNNLYKIGHGVVPIRIEEVIQSDDSEIKLYIQGSSKKYYTFTYDLPVPIDSSIDKFPYEARATFCYTPKCTRNHGVDYSNLELRLKFGRMNLNSTDNISSINLDSQGVGSTYIREQEARNYFRKWDNTKVLRDNCSKNPKPKVKYGNDNWGICVSYISRDNRDIQNQYTDGEKEIEHWGLVITLRAIDRKNRIDEFIRKCTLNNWFVFKVDIKNRVKLYAETNEEIDFEK